MFVIALGHKARHGKNFCAREMITHAARQGLYAKDYAFADALKTYCRVAFGMREKNAPLLQTVGTDVFRKHVDPDIWVNTLVDTIKEQEPDLAIITDVRFPNECAAVKDLGGALVKVSRLNTDGTPWVAPDRDPKHPSETALDDFKLWDTLISVTDGEIHDLRRQAVDTFRQLYPRVLVAGQDETSLIDSGTLS